MTIKSLMIQGTTSDAGKSTVVTGLCRALYRRGIRVAPFKPQNMALNSAVSVNNGEIGRAQAVQAQACGIDPHTDMNPVLLKPSSETGSQVIIQGRAIGNMTARDYHGYKVVAMDAVLDSFARLSRQYDVVLVEGAGSPAEINLRDNDIANMGFAEAVDCPVLLVGDIERGGVFAQLVGTLALLSPSERARVRGLIINRFRGELNLLTPGIHWLEQYTEKSVVGVLPYEHDLYLEAEDSLNQRQSDVSDGQGIRVVVPALPRMSNHTDFDALSLQPSISVKYIKNADDMPACDLIVLPGSKSVRDDLQWLRNTGWDQAITRHLRYGGKLLGICGGFQMMGQTINDPQAVEGARGTTTGLGYFDIHTTLTGHKTLANVSGTIVASGDAVNGYEIHMGNTQGNDLTLPFLQLGDRYDGVLSTDRQLIGTYVHGLFDNPTACKWIMQWAGLKNHKLENYDLLREQGIDKIADLVETQLDMQQIYRYLDIV